MRIGSLCSGYGGLDFGLQAVVGGTVAWHAENDPGAAKILAYRWPDVPNLGDITTVDWAAVEPVDWLTAGFPCQDLSHAGKRAGMRPGNRSGLWFHVAYAIGQLRPPFVLLENVRGLLSAKADRGLEPDDTDLGDAARGSAGTVRALGVVLGDLADLRYDAQWVGVRAADAGASHERFRVFIAATDTDQPGSQGREPAWRRNLPARRATANATGDGRHEGRAEPARLIGRPHAAVSSAAAPDADRDGLESIGRVDAVGRDLDRRGSAHTAWGSYEPAIRRWEHVTGRLAPRPTEPGARGGQRLSPAFVEWLMGLPAGHVTDVPISRNAQLKALGNGVVPQQAALAVAYLLTLVEKQVAA